MSGCFHANCTMLWSSLGTEETHTEAGGRETRIGRLDPPIVWNDDAGEFAVERFCVCITTPVKGRVRLLCNGAADGNFYGRVFARLRMADKYDWKREQADEKLSGELYEMIVADTAAAKVDDARSTLPVGQGPGFADRPQAANDGKTGTPFRTFSRLSESEEKR